MVEADGFGGRRLSPKRATADSGSGSAPLRNSSHSRAEVGQSEMRG